MYCLNCGSHFGDNEVQTYKEADTGYIRLSCPNCGSEEIEESNICRCCSDPCMLGEDFCDDCKREVNFHLQKMARNLHIPWDDMLDMIAEMYFWEVIP